MVRRGTRRSPRPRRVNPDVRRLGDRIRALRARVGISQEGLAAEAGLHRTTMGAIERGLHNPTYTVLLRIAAALNLNPGRLMED